jgi:hypothetical protein
MNSKNKFKFKTVSFFATKYVSNLVDSLSQLLKTSLNIETSRITLDRGLTAHDVQENETKPTELMFILIPHLLVNSVACMPPAGKYVVYQLEQLNDKGAGNLRPNFAFNALFGRLIQDSLVAFDYTPLNVGYYPDACKCKVRVLIPPISTVRTNAPRATPAGVTLARPDVLFYGSLNSRRNIINGKLMKQLNARGYSFKAVNTLFGQDLLDLVSRSKVVLNIHFYENSILESDRLHVALQFPNVRVVSELPTIRDETSAHLYEAHPRILFCNEIRDYANFDPSVNVTGELFETCLKALESVDNNSKKGTGLDPVCQTINDMCTGVLTKIFL